jgi:hypothetical protein
MILISPIAKVKMRQSFVHRHRFCRVSSLLVGFCSQGFSIFKLQNLKHPHAWLLGLARSTHAEVYKKEWPFQSL